MSEARHQTWLRVGTVIVTTITAGSLLLQDWGPGNCFSPIRPAVKGVLNSWFGVKPAKNDKDPKAGPVNSQR